MDKEHIILEIKRTAEENGGTPFGQKRFETETGISRFEWYGKYWSKWSDAVIEAGFKPNKFNQAYDDEFLLLKLIDLTRELGKYPSSGELRLKANNDKTYPSPNVFDRLGRKNVRIRKIIEYCEGKPDLSDVLQICKETYKPEKVIKTGTPEKDDFPLGFVYLMKSGRFYKIGRSNSSARRHYELNIQMPEKLHLVHEIKTDDPAGIEAYWHQRFEEKRKNGEWFDLSSVDVKAFKRRKFM